MTKIPIKPKYKKVECSIFLKFHESQQKQNAVYKLRHLYQMDFLAQEYKSSDRKQ